MKWQILIQSIPSGEYPKVKRRNVKKPVENLFRNVQALDIVYKMFSASTRGAPA